MSRFDNFSVKKGKSLLQDEKLNALMNEGVYIIGLGGLGGRTVNQIKKVFYDKIDMSDAGERVRFLCIDSCDKDTEKISTLHAETGGMMEVDETFPISDKDNVLVMDKAPAGVNKFMQTHKFPGVKLDANGCQQTRQFGRAALYNKSIYSRMMTKIQNDLTAIHRVVGPTGQKIRIFLFAGISGGTGSGTIIDIAYMLRRVIDVELKATNITLDGYVYLADVQENDEGLKGEDQTQLKANCYAALKEINYFLDLKAVKGSYVYPNEPKLTSEANIFDHCTIISRYSDGAVGMIADDSFGVIEIVADHICFLVSENNLIDDHGNNIMGILSDENNEASRINTFVMNALNQGDNLPDWGMYRYRALSYGDYYLPRDEMIAFIANSLVQKMKTKWEIAFDNRQQRIEINRIVKQLKIDSIDNFLNAAYLAIDGDKHKIDPIGDIDVYPKAVEILGVGKIVKLAECYGACQGKKQIGRLDHKLDAEFVNPQKPTSIVRRIKDEVDKAFLDVTKGPYFAINLLSATENRAGFNGIMSFLEELRRQAQGAVETYNQNCRTKRQQILNLQESLNKGLIGKTKEDAEGFAKQCNAYIKLLIQYDICMKLVDHDGEHGVITKIIDEINRLNTKLYSKFTVLTEELTAMLKEDSAYVVNPERRREDTGELFSFNVTNCEIADTAWLNLQNYFTSYVQTSAVDKACEDFINNVIKSIYDQYTDHPEVDITDEDLRKVIRDFFDDFFSPIVGDFLEKLCVVAFSPKALSADQVEEIWKDTAKRTSELTHVADCIRNVIGVNVLLDCKDGFTPEFKDFAGYNAVRLLNETVNLSRILSENMQGSNQAIGYSNATDSSFYTAKLTYGVPVFLINQMPALHSAYELKKNFAGIHMNEVDEVWHDFPEPYGYAEAQFLGNDDVSNAEFLSDRSIYEDIYDTVTVLKEYGMILDLEGIQNLYGFSDANAGCDDIGYPLKKGTDPSHPFEHLLCADICIETANDESLAAFKSSLEDQLNANENLTFAEGLRDFAPTSLKTPIALRLKLQDKLDFFKDFSSMGDKNQFGNLIKIIRRSPRLTGILKDKLELFKPYADVFEEAKTLIAKRQQFGKNMASFILALKYNQIYYNADKACWCYSIVSSGTSGEYAISKNLIMRGAMPLKKEFQIYHAFKEYCVMHDREKFDAYVGMLQKSNRGTLVNRNDIADEAARVLENDAYLNAFIVDDFISILRDEAEMTPEVSYDYPKPIQSINTDEGAYIAIDNLKQFYTKLKNARLDQVL